MMAFNHPTYGKYAYNLALSIKKFNPDIHIHLIHDQEAIKHLTDYCSSFFNIRTPIKNEDLYHEGKFSPAKAKSRIYDYLVFEENLYLDVDACALKDLQSLIDSCSNGKSYYYTQVHSTHNIKNGSGIIEDMAWATAKTIWEHYRFSEEVNLPATQSSFAYIKKGKEAATLFESLKKNVDNPIPLGKLEFKWGGGQPDELYLNVTLAQLGIDASLPFTPIFFSNDPITDFQGVTEKHYLLGLFGGHRVTHKSLNDWYDRLMHAYCREHYNTNHIYKQNILIKDKHSGKR